VIELNADLGGGKTTFVKGLVRGLGGKGVVSSPTFTINRIYMLRDGFTLHHFDFYRLAEPGIIWAQLSESLNDPKTITVVEWADSFKSILPGERLSISLQVSATNAGHRQITIRYADDQTGLVKKLESSWKESRP